MTLLLDTHALLWLVSGDSQLSQAATDVLIEMNGCSAAPPLESRSNVDTQMREEAGDDI